MTDVLNVLILSGHMTREHDNEHRSFRQHNQWLITLLEDTGRFTVRVVEDPRGLGAEIIDKYDVLIVVFEGCDGYFDKAVGEMIAVGRCFEQAMLFFKFEQGSMAYPDPYSPEIVKVDIGSWENDLDVLSAAGLDVKELRDAFDRI